MTFSLKGFFLFAFSLMIFNIGLALNNVDQDIITICSFILSVTVGTYFMTGKIFEGEEKIDE